jgi:hypothetical protein
MPHSISPELNDLFRKVLAKDVDARYLLSLINQHLRGILLRYRNICRLSIDDIEKHPWMVKEVHVPLSTADSVLEEGGKTTVCCVIHLLDIASCSLCTPRCRR